MESLPLPNHSETAQPGPSSQPPSYKNAQVWKEIQAETGFASCADYLEFYKDVRPELEVMLRKYQGLPKNQQTAVEQGMPANQRTLIVICDLLKQKNLPISLSLRRHCYSGTEVIQALREPPSDVCVQLVLWFFPDESFNQEMADTLVLGLKLDPQLLEDIENIAYIYTYRRKDFRASQVKRVIGNHTVAAISKDFMPQEVNTVPVLLVLSDIPIVDRQWTFEDILARRDSGEPPIHRSAPGESMPFGEMGNGGLEKRGQSYARTVVQFIVQGRSTTPSDVFPLLAAASPLIYVEAYRVQEASNEVRYTLEQVVGGKMQDVDTLDMKYVRDLDKNLDKDLDRKRLKLRRTFEEAEDNVSEIFRYLGSGLDLEWSKEPSYVNFKVDWKSLIDEARRLETEVRDYMQLRVGDLSLEESRRSIELSNIQIRESKSVKIFTILAFVYVPLNLATSIFGMNIQQFNQSGQNLWVFFVTAIVALLLTGGSWLCSNSTYKAMVWYKERAATKRVRDNDGEKREYGLLVRMAMLVWLVRNGHKAWMWKSGAWIAILMNSKVPGQHEFFQEVKPACDYVSVHSQPGHSERDRDHWFVLVHGVPTVNWSPLSRFSSWFSKSRASERDSSEYST